jgi:hypothetical protein
LDHERHMILSYPHKGVVGGHYTRKVIDHKILRIGLWWENLHKDTKEFYHTCDVCHRIRKPSRREEMSLVPQVRLQAFDK